MKIFAFGKLNNKNDSKTITCEIKTIENSIFSLFILTKTKIKFIINKFKVSNP